LKSILKKAARKLDEPVLAYNIAELGIGLNPGAKIIGNPLVDEKVMGTIHVAIGDNSTMGGVVKAGIHLDGIVKGPTLTAGSKVLIKHGKPAF
jgi:leucyl aminopeptidase (aminopeptidase T)